MTGIKHTTQGKPNTNLNEWTLSLKQDKQKDKTLLSLLWLKLFQLNYFIYTFIYGDSEVQISSTNHSAQKHKHKYHHENKIKKQYILESKTKIKQPKKERHQTDLKTCTKQFLPTKSKPHNCAGNCPIWQPCPS